MNKIKEIMVGLLVIIAIAISVIFIFTFGTFEKNRNYYQIKAIFSDVNNLETGTPVILNGVKVGDVRDIYIENEKVAVILNIKKNIKIRKGARMAIMLKGLIGDLTVGIYNPKTGDDYLKSGDVINGIDPVSVNSLIEKSYDIMKMSDKLSETLEKMEMDKTIEDTRDILKNLKDASGKLSATLDSTKLAMDNANDIMKQNKKSLNDSIEATKLLIKKIDSFIDKKDSDLKSVTDGIAETVKQIKEAVAVNRADIDKSVKNIEKISNKTAAILEKVSPQDVEKIKSNMIEITEEMKVILKKASEITKDGSNKDIKESIRKAKESTDKLYSILNNKLKFEGQVEVNNKKKFSGNVIAEMINFESDIYIKAKKENIDNDYGENSITAGKYFNKFKIGAGLVNDKAGFEAGYFINKKISINGEYFDLKNGQGELGADYEREKYRLYFRYNMDDIYRVGAGYKF